jgi:hypothetical protein
MVFETDAIPILIRDLARVIHCGILVDDRRRRFEHIDKEHSEKETNKKRQKLQMIEEFHSPPLLYIFKLYSKGQ